VSIDEAWMSGKVCGARTKQGGVCQRPAGEGTDHRAQDGFPGTGRCRWHAGRTPTHEKKGALEQMQMRARVMGLPIDIGPHDLVAECIRVTAGELAYCNERIAELTEGDALIADTMEREYQDIDRYGEVHNLSETRETSNAQLHMWIRARHEVMKLGAHFAKLAADMGVAERQVRVVEQWGDGIATYTRALLADLGVPLDDQKTRAAIERQLAALGSPEPRPMATLTPSISARVRTGSAA
jgi:hypothetical protein